MTIAQSTNALEITDAYGSYSSTSGIVGSQINLGMFWRVPILHSLGLSDANDKTGGKFRGVCHWKVSNSQTTSLACDIGWNATKFNNTEAPDETTVYSAAWFESTFNAAQGSLEGSPSKLISGGPDMPRILDIDMALTGGKYFETFVSVRGLGLAELNEKSEADAGIKPLETTGIHDESAFPVGATKRTIFDANMPCSAYLMKRIVADNSNAFAFKTLTVFNFPILGIGSTI